MSITGTGFLIIVFGIYSFFFNKKLLYNLTIFFIPFSATAVINFGEEGNGSAIQPFMFLGSLWLFKFILSKANDISISKRLDKKELIPIVSLIGFVVIAFLSLAMPVFIDGNEMGNVTGGLGLNQPISFSFRNVTQYIYLLFGVIFSIGLYSHNKNLDNYAATIKTYTFSIIFVMIWGAVEIYCNFKNINYPAFLFNNSYNPSAAGYKFFTDPTAELKRISSVAIEPSILVQSVVLLIPFLLIGIVKKAYLFNKIIDFLLVISLFVFTIRTTSSSGILCLIVISLMFIYYLFANMKLKSKLIFIATSVFTIPLTVSLIYYLFQDIVNKMLFEKGESFSSLERLGSILDAWDTFLKHPILGAGWASVTSFDLFVKILSNTGLLGFGLFMTFLASILISKFLKKSLTPQCWVLNTSITISFCTIIFSNMINTFSFIFGSFWLVSGLALINIKGK